MAASKTSSPPSSLTQAVHGYVRGSWSRLTAGTFILLLLLPSYTHSGLVRKTDKGLVRGVRFYLTTFNKEVEAYLGIPFAKPPIKHRRFRPPEPIDPWYGVRNATKKPNACYQSMDLTYDEFVGSNVWNPTTRMSEDCLYLNVWVPKINHKRPKKLAVMVWIFGGGFYSGTPTLNLYDGRILAALNDVVVVSIGYRVGPLGFLCLNDAVAPGNAGMYDQLMGLEWVQKNIRNFGGDPDNVTLFGESAGSVSVSMHLMSPLSHNKFHRAIMQSGTANTDWATVTKKEAKRRSLLLAYDALGCPESEDMTAVLRCLQEIGPKTIVEEEWISRGVMQFPFVPVIDGLFLKEHPAVTLQQRSFKKCPILIGTNANEGSWFIIYELSQYLDLETKMMNDAQYSESVDQLFKYYPQFPQLNNQFGRDAVRFHYKQVEQPNNPDLNLYGLDQAVADVHFVCPSNTFATAFAEAGENVYNYVLTQRYSNNPWPSWMGVLHGDDIFFTFGELLKNNVNNTADDHRLSRKIMQYWTSFAKFGDPNYVSGGDRLGEWPIYTPRGKEYLEIHTRFLDEPDRSKAVGNSLKAKNCLFWSEYMPKLVKETADITDEEKRWKLEFNEWSTRYIVDWKIQYERFIRTMNQCSPNNGN